MKRRNTRQIKNFSIFAFSRCFFLILCHLLSFFFFFFFVMYVYFLPASRLLTSFLFAFNFVVVFSFIFTFYFQFLYIVLVIVVFAVAGAGAGAGAGAAIAKHNMIYLFTSLCLQNIITLTRILLIELPCFSIKNG